jgi:hypothetical protein
MSQTINLSKWLISLVCTANVFDTFTSMKNKSFEFLYIIKKNVYFCKSK